MHSDEKVQRTTVVFDFSSCKELIARKMKWKEVLQPAKKMNEECFAVVVEHLKYLDAETVDLFPSVASLHDQAALTEPPNERLKEEVDLIRGSEFVPMHLQV
jgi:hypothetical protein